VHALGYVHLEKYIMFKNLGYVLASRSKIRANISIYEKS
jgi:hypothetical protein